MGIGEANTRRTRARGAFGQARGADGTPREGSRTAAETPAFLTEQVRRFETALAHMNQGLSMFDAEARLVVCNPRYREIFGLPAGALAIGMTQQDVCRTLIANRCYPPCVTLESLQEATRRALKTQGGVPVFRSLADGRVLSILYRAMEGGGWVSTFEDITEQKRSEARIAHLARHDGLTDLVSARTLREEGAGLLAGMDGPVLAVLHLDLDRFKLVNDTHGHAVGDDLLRAVAGRLRSNTRRGGILARLGGDEFAVIQGVFDEAGALALAGRLRAAVEAPVPLAAGALDVGVSIGVAVHRGPVTHLGPLLREADLALRHAKEGASGAVTLFDPGMSDAERLRRTLEADLHVALEAGQFEVHYQPLVDLGPDPDRGRGGDRTIGVEALLRWRHPERGMVPPLDFIPLAEETGFIAPLGEWVLGRACRDAATWAPRIGLAVNVSGVQMRLASFADSVLGILRETGLDPGRLEIEMTESILLDESEATTRNIGALRAVGVRFAMDDFGTGYSSLSYLRRFPIDKIKIDRSFMADAETDAGALAILRAVASLGTSLGLTTLAEGVETKAQLELARAEGVGQVQGYFFSRPQPFEAITAMLREDPG